MSIFKLIILYFYRGVGIEQSHGYPLFLFYSSRSYNLTFSFHFFWFKRRLSLL